MATADDDVPVAGESAELERWLARRMSQLQVMVDSPLTQDVLVQVTALYNDVAYLFVELDARQQDGVSSTLRAWRSAFFEDGALRERILTRLGKLRCSDTDVEKARASYFAELVEASRPSRRDLDEDLRGLLQAARAVVEHIRGAEASLLGRVGVAVPAGARPAAIMYQLLRRTDRAEVREKLARAWSAQRASHRGELLGLVDRMIEVRRVRAAERGATRVIDEVFARCSVVPSDVEAFLDEYLSHALESLARLSERIAVSLGVRGWRAEHFGYYVRSLIDDREPPLFSLDVCLRYILAVAGAVFGLECDVRGSQDDAVLEVLVTSASGAVGHIKFWPWAGGGCRAGNHTKGARNRTDWRGLRQLPVAHVCCSFSRAKDGAGALTFQNVHSLFHEFGHAINHLLIDERISNRAGLEYLPLERLEQLSLWFEKWAYHPAFAAAVAPSAPEQRALQLSQQVKALEYVQTQVERGVVATLDYAVHSRCTGGVREAFAAIERAHALEGCITLDDVLEYFTWPMFQANPGANFSYLWGAVYSAEKFRHFEGLELSQVASQGELRQLLASSFDLSRSTSVPQVEKLFAFYDRVAAAGAFGAEREKHV